MSDLLKVIISVGIPLTWGIIAYLHKLYLKRIEKLEENVKKLEMSDTKKIVLLENIKDRFEKACLPAQMERLVRLEERLQHIGKTVDEIKAALNNKK